MDQLKEEGKMSTIITSLPDSAVKYLGEEITSFCREAGRVGIDCHKKLSTLCDEVNLIVSEIYSPPRVTHAARILKKLGISLAFALDITSWMKKASRGISPKKNKRRKP